MPIKYFHNSYHQERRISFCLLFYLLQNQLLCFLNIQQLKRIKTSQQFQSMKGLDSSVASNTQLNSSSSKMKYSFPKSNRFDGKQYDSPSPNKFYDLPEIRSRRGAGIGYGNKMDLSKQNFLKPGPSNYSLGSSFDLKKTQGITIAEGRDKIIVGDMFRHNFKVPSPFQYSPDKLKKSISYSMSAKLDDTSDKWIKMVPGPGRYSQIQITNKQSKIPIAKYTSAPSAKFGHDRRLSEVELKKIKTPGPSQYNNQTLVSKRFSFKRGSQFPKSNRPDVVSKFTTPGPGVYNRASDFD